MNASTGALADDFVQRADEYLNQELGAERFMGSVMVAKSNSIVFIKGYGTANREYEIPNAQNTKFRIGSITKQFTAVCVLKLQEQEKLSLDDLVSKFVENCPAHWNEITIRHLLTHTSGIPNYSSLPRYFQMSKFHWSPAKWIERFRDSPLEFAPGAGSKYSNSGYFLLGYIVEKASGAHYEDYLQETVFKPLGMANSGYDHFAKILPHRAAGYTWDGAQWKNAAYIDTSVPYAAGALYSTAEDFFLWYQCWREHKILSEASWKTITASARNSSGSFEFGINISEQFGHRVFQHGGGINGFRSFMSWFPEADFFVCAFGNADSAKSDRVVKNLAAIMFKKPLTLPQQKIAVQLSPTQLETLVGRYELRPNFVFTATVSGDRLFVQATGQSRIEFLAESENNFHAAKVLEIEITFCRDPAGNVTHLVLNQNGRHEAKRLKD
jgi:CubicO group peptidase (beta-lactamase class C family)